MARLRRVSQKGLRIPGTNQRGMSRSELNRLLKDVVTWETADEACRSGFALDMRDCRYGYEAARNAWDWFYIGWKAAMEEVGERG